MKYFICLFFAGIAFITVEAQTDITLKSRKELPKDINWINICLNNGNPNLLGQNLNNTFIYNINNGIRNQVKGALKVNGIVMIDNHIYEAAPSTINIYDYKGNLKKSFRIAEDKFKTVANIYLNKATNDLYYGYYSSNPNTEIAGVVRQNDKKTIIKYNRTPIGFSFPQLLFNKNYYLATESDNYEIIMCDMNNTPIKTFKHSEFIRSPLTTEELKYTNLGRYITNRPIYPKVILKLAIDNESLVVYRAKRPGGSEMFIDCFNLKDGKLIRTLKIPINPDDKISDALIYKSNIYILAKDKNEILYLQHYKVI